MDEEFNQGYPLANTEEELELKVSKQVKPIKAESKPKRRAVK